MWSIFWNFMAVLGIVSCIFTFFIVICIAASPPDRKDEDAEQIEYLKRYSKRKGDKR